MGFLEDRLQALKERQNKKLRAKLKANYKLAKSLGFSGSEASILQSWKEENIRELARERGLIKKQVN